MATDSCERLHLKFLKWTLGLHKKSSNIFWWGDSGRSPLIQQISKQALNYFERVDSMSINNSECLSGHAFAEQKKAEAPMVREYDVSVETPPTLVD